MKKTTIVRTWFPTHEELFCDIDSRELKLTTKDYLHSLWVGFTTPIITMPEIIWRLIIKQFLRSVYTIMVFVMVSWFNALRGRAIGVRRVEFDDSKTDGRCDG